MPDSPTILIVEDEPLVRFSFKAYLEDSGFRCLEARDGAEGLKVFEASGADLVMTDLWMPVLDGFGVLVAVRERSPGTPVLVLTGTGDEANAEQARALGARACLFKPILNMRLLVQTIRDILDSRPGGGQVR